MNWLATGDSAAIANFGWLVGAFAGTIVAVALILAIRSTPQLREHGDPEPEVRADVKLRQIRARMKKLDRLTPALVAAVWLSGWWHVGNDLLVCYARCSAAAAAIVIGLTMLVLFPLAATQIARRSIW